DPGGLPGAAADRAGHGARLNSAGSYGAAGEPDAAGAETKVCRLRRRYVRHERRYFAANGRSLHFIAELETMRLRPIVWAVALAAGFIYLTSNADWSVRRIVHPFEATGR